MVADLAVVHIVGLAVPDRPWPVKCVRMEVIAKGAVHRTCAYAVYAYRFPGSSLTCDETVARPPDVETEVLCNATAIRESMADVQVDSTKCKHMFCISD